jgi:hypothetical protein
MYPTFEGSEILACKLVTEQLFVQGGKTLHMDTLTQGILFKRLFQAEKQFGNLMPIRQ